MNRARSYRLLVGSMVAAGLAGIILGAVSAAGFSGLVVGDSIASPASGLNRAILLVGGLMLLGLEMAHIASRRPRPAVAP